MILVTGVSCSGKTHTLERLGRIAPGFRHVRASAVLRSLDRPILDLTVETALANQRALVAETSCLGLVSDEDAVLDGHATIDTTSGPFRSRTRCSTPWRRAPSSTSKPIRP